MKHSLLPLLALSVLSAWYAGVATAQDAGAPAPVEAAAPAEAPKPAVESPKPAAEAAALTATETWTGPVATMAGADRFQITRDDKAVDVRLYGVDAPETGQPYAEEAKKAVVAALGGGPVRVDVLTTDNLGIAVAMVYAGETNLGSLLVSEGLAWYDDRNAAGDRELKKLNAQAIAGGKGLWADAAPLAPWDYRRSHGGEQFSYSLKPKEEPKPEVKEEEKKAEEEPKVLSAKGEQEYRDNFTIPKDAKLPEGVNETTLLMKHMPRIEMDAAGKPLGFTASNISEIPYAKELGFQDGDIISNVNGIQVTDMAQIMSMAPQFKDVKEFNVTVIRGGKPLTRTIRVP